MTEGVKYVSPFLKQRITLTGKIVNARKLPPPERTVAYVMEPDNGIVTHLRFIPECGTALRIGETVTISGKVEKYKRKFTGTDALGFSKPVTLEKRHG